MTNDTAPADDKTELPGPASLDRTGREIIIGFLATPIAGVAGGMALQLFMNFLKARLGTASEILGFVAFWGILGSIFAAPTTLIGLPAVGAYVPASSSRPAVLTCAGFILGWLTMMFWALVFFGVRYYRQLHYGYAVPRFLSFCLVGAMCGAATGLFMGWIARQYSDG